MVNKFRLAEICPCREVLSSLKAVALLSLSVLTLVSINASGAIGQQALSFKEGKVTWGQTNDGDAWAESEIEASDGSGLIDTEVTYMTRKRFDKAFQACVPKGSQLVEKGHLLDEKGRQIGQRVATVVSVPGNQQEGVVVCRTDTKKQRLWTIWGRSLEQVSAYERATFP